MIGFSIESFFSIIEEMPDQAILLSVPDLRIVHANQPCLSANGLTLEEAKGLFCYSVTHHQDSPCDSGDRRCPVQISMETEEPSTAIHSHKEADGKEVLVHVTALPIRDSAGKITHVLEIIRRKDELTLLYEELKQKTGFLEDLIQTCPNGIVGNDRLGNIFLFNEGAEKIFGYNRAEVIGKIKVKNLYPEGKAREIMEQIRSENYGGREKLLGFETHILDKRGRAIPIRISCTPLYEDGLEVGVIGFFTDISQRKAMEEKLVALTITDGLTGLYNRRHFQVMAQHEIERIRRSKGSSSLILLDVDNFKQYNDTYGHLEGDVVLQTLGQLIRISFRTMDIAFRFGGEEFVILLPDTSPTWAFYPAERFRVRMAETTFLPAGRKEPARVTISIGIAKLNPEHSFDEVVRLADEAMYAAKKGGRNRTVIFGQPGPSGSPDPVED